MGGSPTCPRGSIRARAARIDSRSDKPENGPYHNRALASRTWGRIAISKLRLGARKQPPPLLSLVAAE
jgi:hypothetical protein